MLARFTLPTRDNRRVARPGRTPNRIIYSSYLRGNQSGSRRLSALQQPRRRSSAAPPQPNLVTASSKKTPLATLEESLRSLMDEVDAMSSRSSRPLLSILNNNYEKIVTQEGILGGLTRYPVDLFLHETSWSCAYVLRQIHTWLDDGKEESLPASDMTLLPIYAQRFAGWLHTFSLFATPEALARMTAITASLTSLSATLGIRTVDKPLMKRLLNTLEPICEKTMALTRSLYELQILLFIDHILEKRFPEQYTDESRAAKANALLGIPPPAAPPSDNQEDDDGPLPSQFGLILGGYLAGAVAGKAASYSTTKVLSMLRAAFLTESPKTKEEKEKSESSWMTLVAAIGAALGISLLGAWAVPLLAGSLVPGVGSALASFGITSTATVAATAIAFAQGGVDVLVEDSTGYVGELTGHPNAAMIGRHLPLLVSTVAAFNPLVQGPANTNFRSARLEKVSLDYPMNPNASFYAKHIYTENTRTLRNEIIEHNQAANKVTQFLFPVGQNSDDVGWVTWCKDLAVSNIALRWASRPVSRMLNKSISPLEAAKRAVEAIAAFDNFRARYFKPVVSVENFVELNELYSHVIKGGGAADAETLADYHREWNFAKSGFADTQDAVPLLHDWVQWVRKGESKAKQKEWENLDKECLSKNPLVLSPLAQAVLNSIELAIERDLTEEEKTVIQEARTNLDESYGNLVAQSSKPIWEKRKNTVKKEATDGTQNPRGLKKKEKDALRQQLKTYADAFCAASKHSTAYLLALRVGAKTVRDRVASEKLDAADVAKNVERIGSYQRTIEVMNNAALGGNDRAVALFSKNLDITTLSKRTTRIRKMALSDDTRKKGDEEAAAGFLTYSTLADDLAKLLLDIKTGASF